MRLRNNAQLGAGFFLATDIDLGGRVLADAHKSQPGNHAPGHEGGHLRRQLALDLRGNGPSVNEVVHVESVPANGYFFVFAAGANFDFGAEMTWISLMVSTGVSFQRGSMASWPVTVMCMPL